MNTTANIINAQKSSLADTNSEFNIVNIHPCNEVITGAEATNFDLYGQYVAKDIDVKLVPSCGLDKDGVNLIVSVTPDQKLPEDNSKL